MLTAQGVIRMGGSGNVEERMIEAPEDIEAVDEYFKHQLFQEDCVLTRDRTSQEQ